MKIHFLPDNITVEAKAGEPLLDVAERAGVCIPTGCLIGSCHACEVEIDGGNIICSCIAAVPRGREEMIVNINFDPSW